ncbi:MAG: heparinase II/III family protein [Opitutus sp.]
MRRSLFVVLAVLTAAAVPFSAAEPYPKLHPDVHFQELKLRDSQGQSWRSAREDWVGARERITGDPSWVGWLSEERSLVDAWMAKHHDRVDWIAGWSNDFVSPVDGSKLTYTDAIPGEEVDHFSSPSDLRVEITPKLKNAWIRLWREKHAQMMERSARLYRLTGDPRYAAWAAGQMDFYAENLSRWEPQRQGARLFWQILTEGVNLITYTQTVRLLGDYAPPKQRARWLRDFFQPEVEAVNAGFPQILNITCWLRAASAQVALVFGDEAMWRDAVDGEWGIRRQIADGVTSDYLWFEQSLSYNNYVVEALTSLFVTAGLYGRADELAHEISVTQNLLLAPMYLRFPGGQLPNPSDQKGLLHAPDRAFLAEVYRVFPTVIGLKAAASRRDWNTLLDPPPAPSAGAPELPIVTSRSLESSRMALLKKGDWQVFFHYGQPPVKSHLQAEVLNFSAHHGETDVTHDPGTAGYGSKFHSEYFLRGLNHNVPLINGEGQEQPRKGRGADTTQFTRAGELVEFSSQPARITAAHPVYTKTETARRTLAIEGDKLIDTAEIFTKAATPQQLGLALHLQGRVRLPDSFAADPDFAKNRPVSFGYWTEVKRSEFRDRAAFDVAYGAKTIRVTLSVPGEFVLWHASTPDVPPERREGFYIESIGTKATFTTTFEVLK